MNRTAETADLSVSIGNVQLANPVLPASGTFGEAYARVFDIARLGALVPKTIMPTPRAGHPAPRLAEAAGGLVNAIGIPTQGSASLVDVVARYARYGPPVVVSLSADTVDDFAEIARVADGSAARALELNLSCPNLEEGGRAFALDPGPTAAVVAACRRATSRPLWIKLSPNTGQASAVARAAQDAGADALIMGNTQLALVLKGDGSPALANRTGGLSGRPLKPVMLRLVDEIAQATQLPIIGCGGICELSDVLDYMAVGASAVAVGTASLARPQAMPELIDALAAHCAAHGLAARDLVKRRRREALRH
ncbi:MAG: dihydroorotate dehydrogenase [Pseudomonadota bacterium]